VWVAEQSTQTKDKSILMKRLRWQLLVVVVALIAIGILLISQQPSRLPGVIPAPLQPSTGGVYTEAIVGRLGRLNPLLDYYNQADHDIDRLIYSSLIRFDDHGLPQGDLAETWGISKDGNVYNFSIRPQAIWHDGQPVTSEDVAFTVDLLRNDAMPIPDDLRQFWKQVEVVILDNQTLQFRLPESFAPFLDYLTFGVLPKHLLNNISPQEMLDASFNQQPIGSGPYQFSQFVIENGQVKGVILALFDKYYLKPPFIEQVVFQYYASAEEALADYRNGFVQGINQIPDRLLTEALKEPKLQLYTARSARLSLVYFNLNEPTLPFFQDASIRRALLMGLNRQWMVDRLLGSQALVAHGPVFPGSWAYYEGIEKVAYNPELALSILKKSGYTIPAQGGGVRAKGSVSLSFDLAYPDQAPFTEIATYIKESWAALGVEVILKAVPYTDLITNYLEPRSFDAVLIELNLARSPDPDPYPFWDQAQITGGQNYSQWNDRQASEYLEQARVLIDFNERLRSYRNFQVRFTAEMPALPLYVPVYTYGVADQVQGVSIGPLYDPSNRLDNISAWYLVAKRANSTSAAPTK
jgi:peptide/nickel transport system substrate-binding protein